MSTISRQRAHELGKEILVSKRGAQFVLGKNGKKRYLVENERPRRTFKPKRGAFKRYLKHQLDIN